MRYLIVCYISLFGVLVFNLSSGEIDRSIQVTPVDLRPLYTVVPDMVNLFTDSFNECTEKERINIILSAVHTMSARIKRKGKTTREKRLLEDGHRIVWQLALHQFSIAQDDNEKRKILSEWNTSLSKGGEPVVSQVCSLSYAWNREMLTDELWKIINNKSNISSIESVCYVLYEKGNKSDMAQLQKKQKELMNPQAKQVLQNTLNWMKYKLADSPVGPGPAALSPHIIYACDTHCLEVNRKEHPSINSAKHRRSAELFKRKQEDGLLGECMRK